jgi:hypothetical protein
MTVRLFSPGRIYFAKALFIIAAIALLLLKSEQHFVNPIAIFALLFAGYYLGKITCSIHFRNMGIGITLLVFILMNIIHSFFDGISFTGQSFFYWVSAVGGHEAIRQPALYVILWAILQPVIKSNFLKIFVCFSVVTGIWFAGIWLGTLSGASVSHFSGAAAWVRYSIFLFIGDIAHHLVDQYSIMKQEK